MERADHAQDLLGIADALPGGCVGLSFQFFEVLRVGGGEGVDPAELAVLHDVTELVGPEVDLRRLRDLRERDQVPDRDGVVASHRLTEACL
jgi:hypothetical protein